MLNQSENKQTEKHENPDTDLHIMYIMQISGWGYKAPERVERFVEREKVKFSATIRPIYHYYGSRLIYTTA